MARNRSNENEAGAETPVESTTTFDGSAPTSEAAATEATATTAEAKEKGPDKRHKKVTYADPTTGESKEWNRVDLIRHFCTPTSAGGLGWTRSEATAKIRELTGDATFRYQIVFQATKGIDGVKKAEKKVKPAEAAATGETAAAPTGEAPAEATS